MEYKNVIGIVSEGIGSHARIKVLSLKSKGQYINDQDEIIELFPPVGNVFCPAFFDKYDQLKLDDFIEFDTLPNNSTNLLEDRDQVILDFNHIPKIIGNKVLKTNDDILYHGKSLNINSLKRACDSIKDGSRFYIEYNDTLIGALKKENGNVKPAVGKEVNHWKDYKNEIVSYNNHSVVVKKLTTPYETLDFMSKDQLQKWFLNLIKASKSSLLKSIQSDKNLKKELSILFQTENDKELSQVRIEKVLDHFDSITLSLDAAKNLSSISPSLSNIFEKKLESIEKEMKEERLVEVKEVDEVINKKQEEIKFIESKLEKLYKTLNTKSSEIEYINNEKERLLKDFQVLLPMVSAPGNTGVSETFYEVEKVVKYKTEFTDIQEFNKCYKNELIKRKVYESRIEKNAVNLLREYRAILVPDIQLILAFIHASNNCRYIIQQVEPDWLKFNFLWKNGLERIVKLAYDDPNVIHLLILQDVNLASPECWAKVLNDVMNNIRSAFPTFKKSWPENLKVVGTKISSEDPSIGLPLLAQTFEGWGGVKPYPKSEETFKTEESFTDSFLSVKLLNDSQDESENYVDEYFD